MPIEKPREPRTETRKSGALRQQVHRERCSAFSRFAQWISHISGKPATFILACIVVAVWAVTGPMFHYSDTWQLVINTGTTIITFLMVFLIQNTQTRDTYATLIKLNELIRVTEGAHTILLELEELSPDVLEGISKRYQALATTARDKLKQGIRDTGSPEIELFVED
jgi:low affinity Fe/Cu permease